VRRARQLAFRLIGLLPSRVRPGRKRLRRLARPAWLGTLRRTTPLSDRWGSDRGTPIDRYYIERFLAEHRADIRGVVLEVKDREYTELFGNAVERSEVVDIDAANPNATLVADLAMADAIPPESFDCFILTQTLQLIYDVGSAVRHAHRILKPGGVLLATVPVTSRIVPRREAPADYWRFTPDSCRMLFGEVFGNDAVTVRGPGNALIAAGFLFGMAHEEFSEHELTTEDQLYPLVVTIRAVKRSAPADVHAGAHSG
jgi:SAM-dependent methyltransferase